MGVWVIWEWGNYGTYRVYEVYREYMEYIENIWHRGYLVVGDTWRMGRVECGGYIGHRQHVECMGYMWHRSIWGIYGIYGICEAQGTYGAWGTYGELAPRQPSLTPCPIGRCLLPRAGSQGVLCHPPGLREERHEVSELAVGTHEGQGAQVAEVPMCSTAPQQGACGGPVLQRFGVLTSSPPAPGCRQHWWCWCCPAWPGCSPCLLSTAMPSSSTTSSPSPTASRYPHPHSPIFPSPQSLTLPHWAQSDPHLVWGGTQWPPVVPQPSGVSMGDTSGAPGDPHPVQGVSMGHPIGAECPSPALRCHQRDTQRHQLSFTHLRCQQGAPERGPSPTLSPLPPQGPLFFLVCVVLSREVRHCLRSACARAHSPDPALATKSTLTTVSTRLWDGGCRGLPPPPRPHPHPRPCRRTAVTPRTWPAGCTRRPAGTPRDRCTAWPKASTATSPSCAGVGWGHGGVWEGVMGGCGAGCHRCHPQGGRGAERRPRAGRAGGAPGHCGRTAR